MSNLCQACGVGFPLPSGRCDHCDTPAPPSRPGSRRRCGECGGSGRVSGREGHSGTCYACAGSGYGAGTEWGGAVGFDARPPPGVAPGEHRRGLFGVLVEAKTMLERHAMAPVRPLLRCGYDVFAMVSTLRGAPGLMNIVEDFSLHPSDFLVVDEEHRRLVCGVVWHARQPTPAPATAAPTPPPAARSREDVVEVGNVIFDCCPPSGVSWQVHKHELYDAFAYARAMLVQKANASVRPRAYCGVGAFAMASALPQVGPNGVLGAVDFCEDVSIGPLDFLVVDEERRRAVRGTLLNFPVGFDQAVGEQRVQAQQVQDGRRFDLEA